MFPAAVVFRGIDGFAQDGGRVEQGDGFRFPGETVLQAFVDFQAVVIPVARVVKGEGEFMVGDSGTWNINFSSNGTWIFIRIYSI